MLSQSTLACLAMLTGSAFSYTATQLYNFTSHYVDIENSHIRPNGELILTTFDNASVYLLDPKAATPEASLAVQLPGVTAVGGITSIGYDKYAIAGGIRGSYAYTNETVFIVDFASTDSDEVTVTVAAELPDAVLLNGMAALPAYPHIILLADSRVGCIWRVDTDTGDVEVALEDDLLAAPANSTVPLGINGLKVMANYAYFTNSERFYFGRVAISENGTVTGDIEVIATLSDEDIAAGSDWDDFIITASGIAYAAQPSNAIAKIYPNGTQEIVVGGGDSIQVEGPTSLDIGLDGSTVYITTRGGTVGNYTYSGAVFEVPGLI